MSTARPMTPTRPSGVTRPDDAPVRRADHDALVGTGLLTRFAIRRDRVRIPVWAYSTGALVAYFLVVIPKVYPDAAARQTRAAIMAGPSGAMLSGPGYGLDDYTLGAMVANELLGMLAVAAALMSLFLVVRHTRADEEAGRTELVRAGIVGRHAPLTAALIDVVAADVAVAVVLVVALVANRFAVPDSLALGAGVGAVGLVFGGVAAVTAQLSEHARTASGAAGAALGLAYLLRAVGDAGHVGGSTLSWFSPIGWVQQLRAFVDLRWWPLALCVPLIAALVAASYALAARRDLGAGLVAGRGGRAAANRSLLWPVGLTFRMERGGLIGWAVGLAVFAALTGSMGQAVMDSVRSMPQLAGAMGLDAGGDVLRTMLAGFLNFFAMAVAVFAVNAVNRLRHEEAEGRTGAVLAAAVGRTTWLGSGLAVAALNSALLLVVSGLALGVGGAASVGRPGLIGEFALASLAYLPVVWCFAGLAALSFGLGRAGTWWVWTLLVGSILVGIYGPVLGLSQRVLDLAPFGLVPAVPSVPLDPAPLVWMAAVAAALVAGAVRTFGRRDLLA